MWHPLAMHSSILDIELICTHLLFVLDIYSIVWDHADLTKGYNAPMTITYPPGLGAPFSFEDLPVNDEGQRIEPESWGPVYDIKRKRGQSVSDAVREANERNWKRD